MDLSSVCVARASASNTTYHHVSAQKHSTVCFFSSSNRSASHLDSHREAPVQPFSRDDGSFDLIRAEYSFRFKTQATVVSRHVVSWLAPTLALPDVGGAMRLGGSADIRECAFFSNVASTRGLAVAVVGSANVSSSAFDGNQLSCAVGSYRSDTEEKVQ